MMPRYAFDILPFFADPPRMAYDYYHVLLNSLCPDYTASVLGTVGMIAGKEDWDAFGGLMSQPVIGVWVQQVVDVVIV